MRVDKVQKYADNTAESSMHARTHSHIYIIKYYDTHSHTKVHFLLKSANFLTDGKVRGMFSKALSKLKTRIHPAQCDKDCMALASRVDDAHGMEKRSLAAEYILRLSALMESPAGRKFTEVVGAIDQAWAPVAKLDYGAGRSNRARRAKPAAQVLSQYAGLNKISGAKTDKDGNALGEEFDLGLSGAFSNLRIVVLQQYTFSFDRPLAALRDKGFEVLSDYMSATSAPNFIPSAHVIILQYMIIFNK